MNKLEKKRRQKELRDCRFIMSCIEDMTNASAEMAGVHGARVLVMDSDEDKKIGGKYAEAVGHLRAAFRALSGVEDALGEKAATRKFFGKPRTAA
jgi:hypothetical protein|tara:strand:- start:191 stop:475 length:285 start_codon:yes stop_codon:yes gene_type:complete